MAGGLVEFIFTGEAAETAVKLKEEVKGGKKKAKRSQARERWSGQNLLPLWAAVSILMTLVIAGWWFFAPLTYGTPGLSVEEVKARTWLGYDLHFAK